jgi:hypothetical protein
MAMETNGDRVKQIIDLDSILTNYTSACINGDSSEYDDDEMTDAELKLLNLREQQAYME